MSKTPNYDTKVKAILDATKPGERICALTGEKWDMTEEEIGWYRKFNVPPSRRAPSTRMQIMTGFWTSYQWWWNKHAETGKPILTFIHPTTGLRVLPDKEWYTKDYSSAARDLSFDRPFFEQLRDLQLHVPLPADRNLKEPENSITVFSQGDVNSYFVVFSRSKDSLYTIWGHDIEDSSEVWDASSVHSSYAIGHSHRIYHCLCVRESFDCLDSAFLFDCRNCESCFGAVNKRNKKYVWFNEQLSKEEWERRRAEVDFSCRSVYEMWEGKFEALMNTQAVWPENFNEHAERSTGEYLNRLHDVKYGYLSLDGPHDCYWTAAAVGDVHDNAFVAGAFYSSECYYTANGDHSFQLRYCYNCGPSQHLEYCLQCMNCENCFGCVGLNQKKFCIFNKQYTEEEYWSLVDQLKCTMLDRGEYGEFFPLTMSPVYFPDSGAFLYYGAQTGTESKLGALEFDPESEGAIGAELGDMSKLRQVDEVPDCIDEVGDEWARTPLFDPKHKRRFAFIKFELAFYRSHRIGAPREHFIARMQKMALRSNSGIFEEQSCANCHTSLMVSVNPGYRTRRIYCRKCYLQYLEQYG